MQNHLRRKCNQSICNAAEPVSPRRTKGASRREAAVTTAPQQRIAPNSHGRTSPKERTSLFPATLQERARARRFSQRSRRPPPPSFPSRRQGAAALSAAVTAAPQQGIASNSHGHTSPKERTSLFPATLRERGSGGEALLLEKRPLPQRLPPRHSSEGGPGEGLLFREAASPGVLPLLPSGLVAGAFAFVAFAVAAVVTRGNLDVSQSANVVGSVMLAAFHAAMDALTLVGHEGFLPVQSVARRGAEESIPRARACDTAQSMV